MSLTHAIRSRDINKKCLSDAICSRQIMFWPSAPEKNKFFAVHFSTRESHVVLSQISRAPEKNEVFFVVQFSTHESHIVLL
jgi:hypothetical protein